MATVTLLPIACFDQDIDSNRVLRLNDFGFAERIDSIVKTNDAGYFQLPALSGTYKLSVGNSFADYSRQMMLNGETPPPIKLVTIDMDRMDSAKIVLLQE